MCTECVHKECKQEKERHFVRYRSANEIRQSKLILPAGFEERMFMLMYRSVRRCTLRSCHGIHIPAIMHRITRIGTTLIIGMPIEAASLPSEICIHCTAKRVLARGVTKSRRKQLLVGVAKRGREEMR